MPGLIQPGTCFIYAVLRGVTGATLATSYGGPFRINTAPRLSITSPSFDTGADYATTVIGNPWDFNDASDILLALNIGGLNFAGGQLNGVNTTDDPLIILNTGASRVPIDAARFRYLSFRFTIEGPQNLGVGGGSVARVFWWSDVNNGSDVCSSKDIVVNDGYNVYNLDLSTNQVVADPAGCPDAAWVRQSPSRLFRFDPHEFPSARPFHLDYMTLRAPQQADQSLAVRWQTAEVDADQVPRVSLAYSADPNGTGQVPIASNLRAETGGYSFDTTLLPNGTYYLFTTTTDGLNATARRSDTPFVVAHAAPPSGAVCQPRPRVDVRTRNIGGALEVTVSATGANNTLQNLTVGAARNALIDMPGDVVLEPNGTATGRTGNFGVNLGGRASLTFNVRRGGPGTIHVPLTIGDACGNWETFVGAGPTSGI